MLLPIRRLLTSWICCMFFLQAIDALTSNYDLTMRPASTVGWISASFFISYPPIKFYISLPRSWRLMSWLISIVNRVSDIHSDASLLCSINCVFCSPFEFKGEVSRVVSNATPRKSRTPLLLLMIDKLPYCVTRLCAAGIRCIKVEQLC